MTIIRTDKRLRERHKTDYYPTPAGLAREALKLIDMENVAFVLDPGAGTGIWGEELKKINNHAYLVGVELGNFRPKDGIYDTWSNSDFLSWDADFFKFDLIMGNPPYSKAEEFIRHSYPMLTENGVMLFLLRLPFLAGQSRGRGLWKDINLYKMWACSRRPSFTGDGNTDDNDYGIYLWKNGYQGLWTGDFLMWEYDDVENNETGRT